MAKATVSRPEVLDLAADLFAIHGYRSTSLEVVARQLGVTRQALYYHFTSKGEILAALYDKMMTRLELAVAAVVGEPGLGTFEAMLRAHLATAMENAHLLALLLHERPEIDTLEGLGAGERGRAYVRTFVTAFERGVREGRLVEVEPVIAVTTVMSAANAITWLYDDGEGVTRESIVQAVMQILAGGYLKPPAYTEDHNVDADGSDALAEITPGEVTTP